MNVLKRKDLKTGFKDFAYTNVNSINVYLKVIMRVVWKKSFLP